MASKQRAIALKANDLRTQKVTSSFWKDADGNPFEAEARSLSLTEKSSLIKEYTDEDDELDSHGLTGALLIRCLYDLETGEQIFEEADRDALFAKNAMAVEEIGKPVMNLNGLGNAKAVEEAEKN